MARYLFSQFYGFPIPKAIGLMIIFSVLWYYCDKWTKVEKTKRLLWKKFNLSLAMGMILIIFIFTISSRGGVSEVIVTPFYSFAEAKFNRDLRRSLFMNVFLFFPLGLTLPYALPSKWKHQALITILFALILSAGIEYLQYYFCLGRAETDDVICNTLGCMIGIMSYNLQNIKNFVN